MLEFYRVLDIGEPVPLVQLFHRPRASMLEAAHLFFAKP